jgi:hypothetical protein
MWPTGIVICQPTRSVIAAPSPPLLVMRVQVSIVGDPG